MSEVKQILATEPITILTICYRSQINAPSSDSEVFGR